MANLAQARTDEDLDLSTLAIPDHARMPPFSLTMAWWAVCSAVFYIVVGATLALTYGARNALIGMALSVVSYGVVNSIISRYAIRTGLSVALFSRVLFGSAGAALATLIFFATAIYYAVFEGSVIAVAAHHQFPALDYKWAALIVVCYSVPLVFGSVQHWLDKFNGVLLPFYLLGLLAAVGLATTEYGYHAAWLDFGPTGGAPAGGWWQCFVYYMGVWVLMMFTFDYARFGRKEDARYHGRFNFGMPFYLVTFLVNGAAGIYLVSTIPGLGTLSEVSVVLALLKLMGVWGLLFVWVTQSRINTANYYLATVNMQAFFQKVAGLRAPKFVWALVVGAVVYALIPVGALRSACRRRCRVPRRPCTGVQSGRTDCMVRGRIHGARGEPGDRVHRVALGAGDLRRIVGRLSRAARHREADLVRAGHVSESVIRQIFIKKQRFER